MRITFYFENYVIGGGSKYVRDCINAALLKDFKVNLLTNFGGFSKAELDQLIKPIEHNTIRVFERTQSVERLLGDGRLSALIRKTLIFITPVLFLLNVIEVWLCLGRNRSEVMIACNGGYPASEPTLAAVIAARLRGLPSVLIIMSTPRSRRHILPGYDWLLDKLVFASVNRVVLNSIEQSRILVRLRGAPEKLINILYNGIPDSVPQHKTEPLIRSLMTLGVVCRLDPMKGLDHLILALKLLPDWIKLRVIGDGEVRESLQKLIIAEGLENRINLTGYINDSELLNEIEKFDIYVFPSLWEGFPYSLLEAMRAGLPIVTTNVGGISEMIRDGEDGLLVPAASPRALADAINTFLCDQVNARRIGYTARMRFQELFSLNKMEENFCRIVNEVKLQKK